MGRSLTGLRSSGECPESSLFLLFPSSRGLIARSPLITEDLRDLLLGRVMRSATFSNLRASSDAARDRGCGLGGFTSSGTPLGSFLGGGTLGRGRTNGRGLAESRESFGGGEVGVTAREIENVRREVGVGVRWLGVCARWLGVGALWLAASLIAPGYHSGLASGSGVPAIGNGILLSDCLWP